MASQLLCFMLLSISIIASASDRVRLASYWREQPMSKGDKFVKHRNFLRPFVIELINLGLPIESDDRLSIISMHGRVRCCVGKNQYGACLEKLCFFHNEKARQIFAEIAEKYPMSERHAYHHWALVEKK